MSTMMLRSTKQELKSPITRGLLIRMHSMEVGHGSIAS